jgi:hypothetical protein
VRPPASAISRRSIKTIWLCLSLGGVLVLLTSCSESADPLPDAVIAQLDRTNNTIADLNADGDELPANVLLQSVLRAEVAGTTLRIVVAAPSGEFVSAKSVVDRYGGTAISYQSERATFEGASRDMTGSQLERAVGAAKIQSDIGESAAAFTNVLESEGLEKRNGTLVRTALLLLFIPAALFMLSGAWSYLQARKRRLRRHYQFVNRKVVLIDWAGQLGPEVESLRPIVAASPDNAAQRTWHDSREFVSSISTALAAATTVGELDVAEMRVGRTAIKLRDLRSSLSQEQRFL